MAGPEHKQPCGAILGRFDLGSAVRLLPLPFLLRQARDLHGLGGQVRGVQIGLQPRQERVCALLRTGDADMEEHADRLQHNSGAAAEEPQRDGGGQQPLEHHLPPIFDGFPRPLASREELKTG